MNANILRHSKRSCKAFVLATMACFGVLYYVLINRKQMGAVWAGFREVHLHRDSEILMFINALMMSITHFLKGATQACVCVCVCT